MLRRVISTGAKAASAAVSRRGFQSLKVVAPKSAIRAPAFRFSSSLTEVLAIEIDEEKNNDDELDQDLIDVQKQVLKSFKLEEKVGHSVVKLTRKFKDEQIEVAFNVQDLEDGGDMGIEEVEEGDEERDPEDGGESGIGVVFTITIKKGGNTVVVDALAGDSLNIQNIRYVDAADSSADEESLFTGPSFEDLEESVQAAFYEYLTERNIDDDLSFFILAHSRDKEQKEYVNWLEKMLDFTEVSK